MLAGRRPWPNCSRPRALRTKPGRSFRKCSTSKINFRLPVKPPSPAAEALIPFSSLSRDDSEHSSQMGAELAHEVAQEGRRRVVSDLTIGCEDLRRVSDVGLRRGHLTGIAEAEHTAQALLTDRCADRPNGGANDGSGYVVEGVPTPRPRRPVDRILQRPGDGSVVLMSDEEDGVGPVNCFLQGGR